jgi:hypothetical protein
MKNTITCTDWRPLHRNTLLGFAEILIEQMCLSIRDVAVHQKNGKRWAQLPAKPQIKDGRVVTDPATGKAVYVALMLFNGRGVADAFSAAVVTAILKHDPHAFDQDDRDREPAMAGTRGDMDDEIPF